jgi:hypothetical protein
MFPRDERIFLRQPGLFVIVGEHAGLHIGLDEALSAKRLQQAQAGDGEGDIELHAQSGRSQDHGPDARRVIVHPGGDDHGAHAVAEHHHVLKRDLVLAGNVTDEGFHVLDQTAEAGGVATLARRAAVPARIPGEDPHVLKSETLDHVVESS